MAGFFFLSIFCVPCKVVQNLLLVSLPWLIAVILIYINQLLRYILAF